MKTTAEMIAVMQAFERGEAIQCKAWGDTEWHDVSSPVWNWLECDYRIKPREPRVIWVNEYGNNASGFYSEQRAITAAGMGATRTAVKFVEVIE